MRRVLLGVLLVLLAVPLYADGEDAIVGLWMTDPDAAGGAARVEIRREGTSYSGRIIWLAEPLYSTGEGPQWEGREKVDRENPDPSLQDRPIIGLEILRGFHYEGGGKWSGGTIYDPNNGKTYKCWMKLKDGKLKLRGYIGFSMLGRTSYWTRVGD